MRGSSLKDMTRTSQLLRDGSIPIPSGVPCGALFQCVQRDQDSKAWNQGWNYESHRSGSNTSCKNFIFEKFRHHEIQC